MAGNAAYVSLWEYIQEHIGAFVCASSSERKFMSRYVIFKDNKPVPGLVFRNKILAEQACPAGCVVRFVFI